MTIKDDTGLEVFDDLRRAEWDYGRYSVGAFEFLNLSPWKSAGLAREKIEEWFAKLPPGKQKELRGRLRGDDRAHSGGLLELVSHEFLLKLCENVEVEPKVNGGRPDFSAVYGDTPLILECTVAQESDKKFGALKRERTVLDIIDAIDAGPFRLMVEPRRVGSHQPSRAKLTKFLKEKLASLGPNGQMVHEKAGLTLDSRIDWRWEDWYLGFRVMVIGKDSKGHAVGGRQSVHSGNVDTGIITRSLERKSEAYRRVNMSYLLVVTQREGLGNEKDLIDALLGPEEWSRTGDSAEFKPSRTFSGFFGSPERPRNRHVSAILYKRRLSSVWDVSNQWMAYDMDRNLSSRPSDWTLVHHPEAQYELPEGVFPFAAECVWPSGSLTGMKPTQTLNAVLGLPDGWPGEEH